MMQGDVSMTMLGRVATIPVHVTTDAELHDAEGRPVLFWFVEGSIRVHPNRLESFRRRVVGGKLSIPMP
jgi:hypothetical protein